ncbi:MAG: ParB/RepB/Spo0J family partition protein [Bacilli bacterium]|nr:ParB/RepB/Spo0J family partition protein [Bacilli bacterium]
MKKTNPPIDSLSNLIKKFSKQDVIAEMEKEYLSIAAKNIPLRLIDDNTFVKRVYLPERQINQFAKNVKERGLFNPLVVRPQGKHYELVLGRKRYFAAKMNHLEEVPVVIKDVSDEETLLMLLADTRDQREANVVEMALIYKNLADTYGYSQKTLAQLSHQSRSQVTNTMRLLSLPDPVVKEVSMGLLSYGHARAILSLSDDDILKIVAKIHSDKLSVRETEDLARNYSKKSTVHEVDALIENSRANRVQIKKKAITFYFDEVEDKDKFIEMMKGKKHGKK